MGEDELLSVFHNCWTSEGFLSREHEEQRLQLALYALVYQQVCPYVFLGKR